MTPRSRASTNAAWSTIGPREVFTRYAVGRISASSLAPIRPAVRGLSRRCTVTTSARASSSSLGIHDAPASAARAAVRCWLHAATVMPNARPIAATCVPSRPSPITPSVLPRSPTPTVPCQRPSRTRWCSSGIRRTSARIKPQVNSAVGYGSIGVPQTTMPRRVAASRSIEALAIPVVTRRRNSERRPSNASPNGVRSRIATATAYGASRAATAPSSRRWSRNASTRARSPSTLQSAIWSATSW